MKETQGRRFGAHAEPGIPDAAQGSAWKDHGRVHDNAGQRTEDELARDLTEVGAQLPEIIHVARVLLKVETVRWQVNVRVVETTRATVFRQIDKSNFLHVDYWGGIR